MKFKCKTINKLCSPQLWRAWFCFLIIIGMNINIHPCLFINMRNFGNWEICKLIYKLNNIFRHVFKSLVYFINISVTPLPKVQGSKLNKIFPLSLHFFFFPLWCSHMTPHSSSLYIVNLKFDFSINNMHMKRHIC
jgi:hypothetical protein